MLLGPGLRVLVGVCGLPGLEWGRRGGGGGRVGGGVVSVCVSVCSGAPGWSFVGQEKLAVFCGCGKDFAEERVYLVRLLVSGGKTVF